MSLDDEARAELGELERAHRVRVPRVLDGVQGVQITLDGRRVVNFASNDYLGLAGDSRVVQAAQRALGDGGAGAGASRLIVGNHREHVVLEAAVADWQRCGGARLFSSGYAANVGILTALLRAGDVVFSDELNHASIIDGCRLSRAEIVVVRHADYRALEAALATRQGRRKLVVTESLFSMDGDLADVEVIAALCRRHGAVFVLDEAHAVGVFGPEGRGLAAERGVTPDILVGTFGKALGSFGAFAATTRAVSDLLWNRARSLVFSTGLPPSVAAAAGAGLEVARGSEGDERRRAVTSLARRFRQQMPISGGVLASPIIPLVIGEDSEAMRCTEYLLESGFFVQGIRPPTVPIGTSRLRVGMSAAHSCDQLDNLLTALGNALRKR